MARFTDQKNRSWEVRITIGAVKRVKSYTGLDILDQSGDNPLTIRLYEDPIQLAEVLWGLISDQAQAQNVTEEDFGSSLGGAAMAQAYDAVVSELSDFFQSGGKTSFVKALKKTQLALNTALKIQEAQVDKLTDEEIVQKIEQAAGSLYTSAPESQA